MPSFELGRISIPLSAIRQGKTEFFFFIEPELKELGDNRVCVDKIQVIANVTPLDNDVLIKLTVSSEAMFYCDRCIEPFKGILQGDVHTLFTSDPLKFKGDEGGDVCLIDKHTSELDITQETVDALLLAVPNKVICQESCKGLCLQCGSNLNETTCSCDQEQIDPRWDALKKLK